MNRMIRILIATLGLLILTCPAAAQQPTQPPPAAPAKPAPAKPKPKKVWTNDEVTTLRSPSDEYEEAKRKQAEEDAKAKQKADTDKATPVADDKKEDKPKDFLPKTVEDAEKLIAAKQYEIGQQYEAVDLVKAELAQATTDAARAAIQKKIDALNATLEEAVAEMKAIDGRLKELKAKAPEPAKPAPPKP